MTSYDFDSGDDSSDVEPFDGAGAFPVDDPPEPDDSPVAAPDDPLFGGLDIGAMAAQLVGPAVQNAMASKVATIAAQAVSKALTPEALEQLQAEADEAAQAVVRGPQSGQLAAGEEDTPQLYYGSTNEFVRDHLRHVYKRKIDGMHTFWSPRWWASAEATARLEALWRAWEHLRLDPSTGPSVWWRDHADHHMSVLMGSVGPFSKEVDVTATIRDPLPHEEPPPELFPDVRETDAHDN